jgi:hypothetical protein
VYFGWCVYNPEKYITYEYCSKSTLNTSDSLWTNFKRVFELLESENYHKMENQNINVLVKLSSLHNEIVSSSKFKRNNGLKTLKTLLFDVAERFYWDCDFEKHFKSIPPSFDED